MKIKPGKNQVTWAITLFILCVSLMLAYYVIFDGKIKIQGKSEDVANDPVAKEFYLGKDFQL